MPLCCVLNYYLEYLFLNVSHTYTHTHIENGNHEEPKVTVGPVFPR